MVCSIARGVQFGTERTPSNVSLFACVEVQKVTHTTAGELAHAYQLQFSSPVLAAEKYSPTPTKRPKKRTTPKKQTGQLSPRLKASTADRLRPEVASKQAFSGLLLAEGLDSYGPLLRKSNVFCMLDMLGCEPHVLFEQIQSHQVGRAGGMQVSDLRRLRRACIELVTPEEDGAEAVQKVLGSGPSGPPPPAQMPHKMAHLVQHTAAWVRPDKQ